MPLAGLRASWAKPKSKKRSKARLGRRNKLPEQFEPFAWPSVLFTEVTQVAYKNERVELEMKILKYRRLVREAVTDGVTEQRTAALIAELEQKLRAIDE
jgi:hypothetical protein